MSKISHPVTLALQVIPMGVPKMEAYRIINIAIDYIKKSGFHYTVTPVETLIEGDYAKILLMIDELQTACKNEGAEIIINMKLLSEIQQPILSHKKIAH